MKDWGEVVQGSLTLPSALLLFLWNIRGGSGGSYEGT